MRCNAHFAVSRIVAACATVLFTWPIAGASAPLANGTLAVRQTLQCCYFEGSVSYVSVRQAGSDLDTVRTSRMLAPLDPTLILGTQLTPGRYVVTSFQRPCDGNCNFLNPPVDQCNTAPIELRPG